MSRVLLCATALAVLHGVLCFEPVTSTSYLLEKFHKGWKDDWTVSDWKKDEGVAGKFSWSSGSFAGDPVEDKGAMTTQDARFYAMSRSLDKVGQNNVCAFSHTAFMNVSHDHDLYLTL